ncbi:MAG: polysaccharide deacetylase family protein [Candidatus Falkowbacteria bacterium]
MLWLNFLHFYQPANAEFYNIRKALDKSYWRLLRLMEEHPNLKMTFNVSGCLLERLEEAKEKAFLERLKFLVKKGRIELTGSAFYHGFLPLLPEKEVVRQIKENEKILKKLFGKNFKPSGFFLPEMSYSSAVAKIIKRLGYDWIILDELAYSGGTKERPDIERLYIDEASGLKVIFRDRIFSSAYPPDKILPLLKVKTTEKETKKIRDEVYLTATDAELYGLRHEDPTGEMEKIVKIKELKTLCLSDYIKKLEKKKALKIKIWSSSWESNPAEIKSGDAYALWHNKKNKIQILLWKLANLSLELETKYKKDKNYYWYRWHLARGLASCTFWWASARDFSKIFGPYAWSPDDIERGLEDLIRSVRSLNDAKTKKKKLEAEKYYLKIKKLIWEEHWKKHWKKQYE